MPLDQEIAIAREHHFGEMLASSLANRASLLLTQNIPLALADATEAVQIARQSGFLDWTYVTALNLTNLTTTQLFSGDWNGCLETSISRDLPEEGDPPIAASYLDISAAVIHEARGDDLSIPAVWRYAEERYTFIDYDQVWPAFCRAVAAWFDGDYPGLVAHGERAIDMVQAMSGFQDDFGLVWSTIIRWSIEGAQYDAARRWIGRVDSARTHQVEPVLRGLLPWLRGTLNARDPEATALPSEIEADLSLAITNLPAAGVVPQRALAQAELGCLLLRQGKPDAAREPLAAAIDTFRQLRAQRWLDDLHGVAPGIVADLAPA